MTKIHIFFSNEMLTNISNDMVQSMKNYQIHTNKNLQYLTINSSIYLTPKVLSMYVLQWFHNISIVVHNLKSFISNMFI